MTNIIHKTGLSSLVNETDSLIAAILDLDIHLQRQVYAGWPASWAYMRWPVGSIRALLLIEAGYARTPGEIADVLKVSRTSVTGILDRLEDDGLMTRTLDPHDRRSFTLTLTDAGRDLAHQIDDLRRSQLEKAMKRLDKESLRALKQGLEALTGAMEVNRLEADNKEERVP